MSALLSLTKALPFYRQFNVMKVLLFSRMTLPAILVVAMACVTFAAAGKFEAKLTVTKDVTLKNGRINYNYLKYLIVGPHPGFAMKRSLLQFTNPSSACKTVLSADLFLYFVRAHKASYMTDQQVPSFPRVVTAHQVLKPWSETEATSLKRISNANWSQQSLGFGTDADSYALSGATVDPAQPHKWYSIDVTRDVQFWKLGLRPNYGLLIRATNEQVPGRDFRFASNAYSDSSKHAYIKLVCDDGAGQRLGQIGGDNSGKRGPGGETPVI